MGTGKHHWHIKDWENDKDIDVNDGKDGDCDDKDGSQSDEINKECPDDSWFILSSHNYMLRADCMLDTVLALGIQ